MDPESPGQTSETDQEELDFTQKMISNMNRHSLPGTSSFLLVLKTKKTSLFCQREESAPLGVDIYGHITCHAARVPYSLIYDGPPTHEKEAEAILSTLE
jgi:hypothetical protein